MVIVDFSFKFQKELGKIKDNTTKERLKKQIERIVENPEVGKPMMYMRKGTREVYISPFRLSYSYFNDKIVFLEIYHKDEQ